MKKTHDKCIRGCGKCCGIVMANGEQFVEIQKYAAENNIEPIKQGVQCPWYQDGECAVYPVRPVSCRLFGKIPDRRMQCHHGGVFKQLRPNELARILERERPRVNEHGSRFLHEVCYSVEEIHAMLKGVLGAVKASQKLHELLPPKPRDPTPDGGGLHSADDAGTAIDDTDAICPSLAMRVNE